MRRRIGFLIVLVLIMSFITFGCSTEESSVDSEASQDESNQEEASSNQDEGNQNEASADFPERTIELVVPFSAGGSTDVMSRQLAKALDSVETLDQEVVVVNREGGGGSVAATEVANAEPDGYTMMIQSPTQLTTLPHLREDIQYSVDDFRVVHGMTKEETVILVNSNSSYETLEDLASDDGEPTWGTGSAGGIQNLAGEMFFEEAGNEAWQYTPFQGGAPAMTALLGEDVDMIIAQVGEAMEHIEGGNFRPIAILGEDRSPALPDTPTSVEEGYDVTMPSLKYLLVPSEVPDDIVEVLNEGIAEAWGSDSYQEFLEENYITPYGDAPEEIEQWILDTFERNGQFIEETGFGAE